VDRGEGVERELVTYGRGRERGRGEGGIESDLREGWEKEQGGSDGRRKRI